jgi:hypothetical protein
MVNVSPVTVAMVEAASGLNYKGSPVRILQ